MIDLKNFIDLGFHHFDTKVDTDKSRFLLKKVLSSREFSSNIFIDESDFKISPQFKGVNPVKGRNLAEKLSHSTLYIENNSSVRDTLETILGHDYKVIDKKFVCGIPLEWIPEWVGEYILETGVKNLGPYIKPKYRDMTYFSGIDFHQDIIDWPGSSANFITMYVYLDDVGLNDAPLHVLLGTHIFGATKFPHKIKLLEKDTWSYIDDKGNQEVFKQQVLKGGCGDINLWHPFILHGTQPAKSSTPRISLRYLIEAESLETDSKNGLSQINKTINGSSSLLTTRSDLNSKGEAIIKGNHINQLN